MIKYIDVKFLNINLCQLGPFIYYFNNKCNGLDIQIIEKIKIWSEKYQRLDILEINFCEDNTRILKKLDTYLKKIFLSYEGKIIIDIHDPNENDIKNIICECIAYYNKKLLKMASNVGNGRRKAHHEYKNLDILNEIIKKKPIPRFRYDIKRYLMRQIKIPDNEISRKYNDDCIMFEKALVSLKDEKSKIQKNTSYSIMKIDKNIEIKPKNIILAKNLIIPNFLLKPKTSLNYTIIDKNLLLTGKNAKPEIKYIKTPSILQDVKINSHSLINLETQGYSYFNNSLHINDFSKSGIKNYILPSNENTYILNNQKIYKNYELENRNLIPGFRTFHYTKEKYLLNNIQKTIKPSGISQNIKNWFENVKITDLPENILEN